MTPRIAAPPLVAVLALASALAGCGSSSDSTSSDTAATTPATTSTPAATQPAGGKDLTVRMTEFAFAPDDATAAAGKVRITAVNAGNEEHELVLLRTDADPANLPKEGGEVDESTSVGEIADVAAGETKSHTFRLKPGRYAMVCALPGHYEGGMYGSLAVR